MDDKGHFGYPEPPGYPQQPSYPQQQAYPLQAGYPQQQAYPEQQAYPPQPGYHQQPGYPQQLAYPQQPGYPPQQAYPSYTGELTTEAPPPYYSVAKEQQQTHNVVVVQNQPQTVVHPIRRSGNNDYGTPALVFAIGVTMFIVFFGCWWSLICTIAGIIFAANASSAGSSGDFGTAKTQNSLSIGCTITGLVSSIVVIVLFFGLIFGIANN